MGTTALSLGNPIIGVTQMSLRIHQGGGPKDVSNTWFLLPTHVHHPHPKWQNLRFSPCLGLSGRLNIGLSLTSCPPLPQRLPAHVSKLVEVP